MLSGTLSKEELINALRTLSQKRRSGVLSLVGRGAAVDVLFYSGRIAAVEPKSEPVVPLIVQRLNAAGISIPGIPESAAAEISLEALITGVSSRSPQLKADVLAAKSAVEKDLLLSVWHNPEGFFDFQGRTVSISGELSLNLSPGQLLLDLVEIESNEKAFAAACGEKSPDLLSINRRGAKPAELSALESTIWEALAQPVSVSRLINRVLIGRAEFFSAFLALRERGLIEIEEHPALAAGLSPPAPGAAAAAASAAEPAESELFQEEEPGPLTEEWRKLLDDETEIPPDSPVVKPSSSVEARDRQSWESFELSGADEPDKEDVEERKGEVSEVDDEFDLLLAAPDEPPKPDDALKAPKPEPAAVKSVYAGVGKAAVEPAPEAAKTSEPIALSKPRPVPSVSTEPKDDTLFLVNKVSAIFMLFFILALGLAVPLQFNHFFEALRDFTSSQ